MYVIAGGFENRGVGMMLGGRQKGLQRGQPKAELEESSGCWA